MTIKLSPARGAFSTRQLLATTAIGLTILGAAPASAAETTPPKADEASQKSEETVELPALSVEGQAGYKTDVSASDKFTAPLLDTPKSITIIPQEVIQQSAATTLVDALRFTPGITMGMGEGGNPFGDRPFIRGLDSSAGITVDGIRDTGSQSRETFNLEQIEVVKGPSGAYGGRGTAGGGINLISKTPKAENFVAGSVTLGTDQTKRVTGDVNYVLGDDVALRLNGMYHDADVAGRDALELSRWGFAPSLTLGLNKPTHATISYYHLQTDDIPDYGVPLKVVEGTPADVDPDNFYGLVNRDFRKTQADIGTLQLGHDFSENLSISNISRYSRTKNDYIATNPDDSKGNVANGYVWRGTKNRDATTETLFNQTALNGEFLLGGLKNNFNAGIELSREEVVSSPYAVVQEAAALSGTGSNLNNCTLYPVLIGTHDCTSLYNPNPYDSWNGTITKTGAVTTTTTNTWSLYAFDTVELSEKWSINLGLRYDDYDTTADTPAYTHNVTGVAVAAARFSNQSDFLSYQTGVVFKPAPNGSIYVNYGTSNNPPGTSGGDGAENISVTTAPLDPEELESFEIGAKWDVFDERMSLGAAVFRTNKDKTRIEVSPGVFVQGGKSRIDGFEITASGKITDKWGVFTGYTYLNPELLEDGIGANEGNTLPNTPQHAFSLWTTYELTNDVTIGGGSYYVGKVYGNVQNTKSIPAYWRFDAMASYQITPNVGLQLNVQNLFDKRYYDRVYTTHMATVAPGRAALISTNFKF